MIEFTPNDGSGKRTLTSAELHEILRKAPRNAPFVRLYDPRIREQVTIDRRPLFKIRFEHPAGFPVDRRIAIRKLYRQHRRRNWPRLRSVLLSVSVAALAGFIVAGFL